MAVTILGISAFYHDSAAALVRDGEIIAAAQEERFSRKKHDPRFPHGAVDYCLEEAFIDPAELDAVVFYDNPLLSFDRVIKSLLSVAPGGEEQWVLAAPSALGVKFFIAESIRRELREDVKVLFTRHHLSHAASAFYPSPFEQAAILTMDGVGEWATTSIGIGDERGVHLLKEIHYPHSLGLLYSAFTYFCGFKVNSGEYKLMGLAPYGTPRYADLICEKLIRQKPDGSFRLYPEYLGYLDSTRMTNERFEALFEGPPRQPESPITQREMDLAASIQAVIEESVLGLARHARELTGIDRLCMAGGVALNCVANGRILAEQIFDDLWIQPAAGDAGGALGAALLASHERFGVLRQQRSGGGDTQKGSFLGAGYSAAEVRAFLDRHDYPYEPIDGIENIADRVAAEIGAGHVVGFFSGRMEFGPRALGARSILADPRDPDTQVRLNTKVKFRESFRPFAPSVLAECSDEYFDLSTESPYMLIVAPVREERRIEMDLSRLRRGEEDLFAVARRPRSDIPAVTHVDYSARVQTVGRDNHPGYHEVLKAFERRTGCAVIVNTSFNVRGEPIVCTPHDAYRCFMRTNMDVLVMEGCLLLKERQPPPDDGALGGEYELD